MSMKVKVELVLSDDLPESSVALNQAVVGVVALRVKADVTVVVVVSGDSVVVVEVVVVVVVLVIPSVVGTPAVSAAVVVLVVG